MKYIEKKDGYVWLVEEHDEKGRFKTYYNLGKDPEAIEKKPKGNKKEEDV